MNHAPALLFAGGMIFAIIGCIHEQKARNQGLPLVHAAAPQCPKLATPASASTATA